MSGSRGGAGEISLSGVQAMMRWMLVGTVAATAVLGVFGSRDAALACTKTNGCVMDTFREDFDMKRDGRMNKAMAAGRANVEAFRSFQDAEQAYSAKR